MVQLGVILTHQYRLLSLAAILDVFETVNELRKASGQPPVFRITLLCDGEEVSGEGFEKYTPQPIAQTPPQDLVLVPAFASENILQAVQSNARFLPWLQRQRSMGAEIASFCTGAFLLAASGLLDGKKATTHIRATTTLASCFPQVQVQPEAVVTQDNGVFTSGGATSSFHLMLRLIQLHCGQEMAVQIAKYFAIDMDRTQQACFDTFSPSQNHGDALVAKAQKLIESDYSRLGSLEEIMEEIPASRRNIVRRFKQVTGITPIAYLQKVRMEAAKKLLEQTDQPILDVMLQAGYNDLKAFRQLFKKSTGLPPKAYREKFSGSRKVSMPVPV
ncbi:GlxA family transcriptional regulator [Sabulibacter ruber]|uniref:GlxA family transcriptional regulator n=1 Tax=Sabulibacter ruber TaxID=2811901 RepID=UPI001A964F70|nr:helix-turn-helix domain-containing protein [Sabulibacter ruber]